jgi:hypothetical protein
VCVWGPENPANKVPEVGLKKTGSGPTGNPTSGSVGNVALNFINRYSVAAVLDVPLYNQTKILLPPKAF